MYIPTLIPQYPYIKFKKVNIFEGKTIYEKRSVGNDGELLDWQKELITKNRNLLLDNQVPINKIRFVFQPSFEYDVDKNVINPIYDVMIPIDGEKEELKSIIKDLNKSATNAGIKPPLNKGEDNNSNKLRKERKEETQPRKPYQPRIFDNEIFEIRTENLGATNCFWILLPENNKLIITINEAHVFYREIYRNMDASARKDMIYLLASIGIAQYETNVTKPDFNPEFFWEDFWSQVSLKLKHLISL